MTPKRKKYAEQWWRKYEVMNKVDTELEKTSPTPPEVFFDFVDSAYEAWLKTGKTGAQIEADIKHHIAMQKVFIKWRKVHGEKI
ncbi:MAG: hypothetical protein ALAOOOJD_00193 [bacterium]|nr:hypothetical protein [bacterium]